MTKLDDVDWLIWDHTSTQKSRLIWNNSSWRIWAETRTLKHAHVSNMKRHLNRLLYSRILTFSLETKKDSFETDVSINQIIILSELNHESNQIRRKELSKVVLSHSRSKNETIEKAAIESKFFYSFSWIFIISVLDHFNLRSRFRFRFDLDSILNRRSEICQSEKCRELISTSISTNIRISLESIFLSVLVSAKLDHIFKETDFARENLSRRE
jgi:hypothetical protein